MYRALITGASRGIGHAIKEMFIVRGIEVLAPTRHELDLTDNESIAQFVAKMPPIDILVNCAGINELASLNEMDVQQLQKMLQVNLTAQAMLIKAVSVSMKQKNGEESLISRQYGLTILKFAVSCIRWRKRV